MFDYSIELQAEKIHNKKTRKYFQEVLSSFINGNYRSALVMLWTVTITDLVFKLQDLKNIYKDDTARKILIEIKKVQDENPTSSSWEAKLIELIKVRQLPLFEIYELTHVEALHKQRHLSAHPIIRDDVELYQPNKETVRAFIRNILEGVLTKAPYASNKIFDVLIADISEKKDLFPEYENLLAYIEAAYLQAAPLYVVKSIFKKLWKFSFALENDKANLNRVINIRVLGVITEKHLNEVSDLISQESEYINHNLILNNNEIMGLFVEYCRAYPKVYKSISEPFNHAIKESIISRRELHSFAPFLYNNIEEIIDSIENHIQYNQFCKFKSASKEIFDYISKQSNPNSLLESYVNAFSNSGSYDGADLYYRRLIQPFLKYFNKKHFVKIIEAIEENSQINSRRQAHSSNSEIKQALVERGFNIDLSSYNEFQDL